MMDRKGQRIKDVSSWQTDDGGGFLAETLHLAYTAAHIHSTIPSLIHIPFTISKDLVCN